jgi:hypothetical protein
MLQLVNYIIRYWMTLYNKVFHAAKRKGATAEDKLRWRNFLLPFVVPVILYQGAKKFSSPLRFSTLIRRIEGLERLESQRLDVEALFIDLSHLSNENEPKDLELCVVFRAFRMVNDPDPASCLKEIVNMMLPELHYPAMRELLEDIVNYSCCSNSQMTEAVCAEILDYIERKGKIKMPLCLFDRMLEEHKKNFAEIKKIQAEKNQIEAEKKQIEAEKRQIEAEKNELLRVARGNHVKTILGFLRYRFGEVSDEIVENVHNVDDIESLQKLSDFVEVCPSLATFEKKMAEVKV